MAHAPWIFSFTFWTIDTAISTLQNKKILARIEPRQDLVFTLSDYIK